MTYRNGNRFSKTITPSGGTPSTRYYSYDASGNIVSEYKRVMVNGVEKSQTLVRYVRDNTGKAISMIQGTNTYYYVYNGHGDVTALTDSTGTVVVTYSYDEFGNQTSSTGNIYNPLRYSGAHNSYYDSETASAGSAQDGLYKMGARYYQPDIGRWLTRDPDKAKPSKLISNASNKYVYVENNPIVKIDAAGLVANNTTTKITVKAALQVYDFANKLVRMNALYHRQTALLKGTNFTSNEGRRTSTYADKSGWQRTYYPSIELNYSSNKKVAKTYSVVHFKNNPLGGYWNIFAIGSQISNSGSANANPVRWYYIHSPHWRTDWKVRIYKNNALVDKYNKRLD